MFRRVAAVVASSLIIATLGAQGPVLALDGEAPVCPTSDFSTNEDAAHNGVPSCSADTAPTYVVDGDGPEHGGLVLNTDGSFTYSPDADYFGPDEFKYTASDEDGPTSQTVLITVDPVNDPPSFAGGPDQTVLEDAPTQTVTDWATVIDEGPNESSQTVQFVIELNTNAGLFATQPAVSPGGNLTYRPATDANGSATITLHAHDSGGDENGGADNSLPQQYTITISPVNDAPSFTKGPDQTVDEDSGAHSVSGWATDIDGGPNESSQSVNFIISSNSDPTLFSVAPAVSPAGILSYTLASNANGSATVGLHAHDSGGGTPPNDDTGSTTTFTIAVSPINDVPTCASTSTATFVDSTLNSTLMTCADTDLDSLDFSLVVQSAHGTTAIDPDGSFSYTPASGFRGNDSFTFKATDGLADSTVATMGILVSPDPIAKNDVAPTHFPAILQGSGPTAIPVLANDLDQQGLPLEVIAVGQGHKGRVVINADGTGVIYDPTGMAKGNDSFGYTIRDAEGKTNSAVVVVVITPDTIKPVPAAPTIAIVKPATIGPTSGNVRIRWGATDVGTGLKSVKLEQRIGTGPWKTVTLATAKATSVGRTFTFGKRYQYRLRATDAVGNVSAWTYSAPFVIGRTQESSKAITYTGSWRLSRSASFSGGSARYAATAGASATYTFRGEGIAWVSSRSSSRGRAQVFLDGSLVGTVNLHGATKHRQVVFSAAWPTSSLHTIQIVVLGTAGHPRVDLDTFVVAK